MGLLSVGLGIIGIVLPGLPTTPFILVAAYFFAKSNKRLYLWLENSKLFGPMIYHWRRNRAIPLKAKRLALAFIALAIVIIIFTIDNVALKVAILAVMIIPIYIINKLQVV